MITEIFDWAIGRKDVPTTKEELEKKLNHPNFRFLFVDTETGEPSEEDGQERTVQVVLDMRTQQMFAFIQQEQYMYNKIYCPLLLMFISEIIHESSKRMFEAEGEEDRERYRVMALISSMSLARNLAEIEEQKNGLPTGATVH